MALPFPDLAFAVFPARRKSAPKSAPLVHPLLRFASSSEFPHHVRPSLRAPSLGFRPSSRHGLMASTSRGRSRARYVPPSPFLTASTVCSAIASRATSPAATSRVLSSGVSPVAQPRRISPAVALLSFRLRPAAVSRGAGLRLRLQGFAPCAGPSRTAAVTPRLRSIPSRACPPSGLSPPVAAAISRPLRPRPFAAHGSREAKRS